MARTTHHPCFPQSVGGLICLEFNYHVEIYNPSTREHICSKRWREIEDNHPVGQQVTRCGGEVCIDGILYDTGLPVTVSYHGHLPGTWLPSTASDQSPLDVREETEARGILGWACSYSLLTRVWQRPP
ncbi:hypothetical protein CDL15_Pgr001521 [Punica granatum]|uniref:Uncharacterized protein n=1 Tax=Punica granatum TaxID=22663 RepID=A0A218X501_PUNGR|nr:hypothetical protein CDL15_Pgr001521 [Punica granatum]